MDRLSLIRSFSHVVEARSYTAAARRLGLSRSHLSKQIKSLEDSLGVRLLNRTTKHVAPTEIGLTYYDICSRLINDLNAADLKLGALNRETRGTLKIVAPKSFAVHWLAETVHDFNERYPDLEVMIFFLDQEVDMIENGFDLSIRIGNQADSSMISKRIGSLEFSLCATPGYLKSQGMPKRPEELTRHICLRHTKAAQDSTWRFYRQKQLIEVKIAGPASTNSSTLLREFVLSGYGIGVLPSFSIRREIEQGILVNVLRRYRLPALPVYAIYPDKRHLPVKVELFVKLLGAHLKHT
jgi:DNA-binding transcriptional LysR family regulator